MNKQRVTQATEICNRVHDLRTSLSDSIDATGLIPMVVVQIPNSRIRETTMLHFAEVIINDNGECNKNRFGMTFREKTSPTWRGWLRDLWTLIRRDW